MSNTFQVDLRGIVDLLSHHLYASPRVYVRELLDDMDPDAQGRKHAAYQLAETLDALGRGEQGEALCVREGIKDS